MNQRIQRVLGMLLAMFSLSMLPPAAVDLYFGEGQWPAFMVGFGLILSVGTILWWDARHATESLRLRDGFFVTALFWIGLGFAGAVPLVLVEAVNLDITDAVFESFSGLTTTGATVIAGLDSLPHGVLYYRQQLQWLGGMGIIVLAVAVLPLLGVGGMSLYRAETPGPVKDNKITPRIAETAKAMWVIYLGLTTVCAVGYWAAGMSLFDAIGHSFTTVAIGGFSTHDASMGFFDSAAIEAIAVFFMVLAGANFTLHFVAWRSRGFGHYWKDPEFRLYAVALLLTAAAVAALLSLMGAYSETGDAIRNGVFMVVSIATTTGFATDDFAAWPGVLPILLLMMSFVGACAQSTGGGMKVYRWQLLYKQARREIVQLIHPRAVILVKLGGMAIPATVLTAVWGFFSAYLVVFGIIMLLVMSTGVDHLTAFSTTAACLNNLGPALGDAAANYASINDNAKWLLVLAMVFGRLEIFTLLVLFTPTFWRR
jgi:trk system potassium uptake protein TrkH